MSSPAAWHPDPKGEAELRWWDGTQWTDHVHGALTTTAVDSAPVVDVPTAQPTVAPATETSKRKVGFFGAKAAAQDAMAENDRLRAELQRLGALEVAELASEKARLEAEVEALRDRMTAEGQALQVKLDDLQRTVVETEEAVILQEVGIYDFRHILEDSVAYKGAIASLRSQFKTLARQPQGAVRGSTAWQVNGSAREGGKMVRDFSKLMLLAYNSEADTIVSSLKPYKLAGAIDRLTKVANTIERLGKTMSISITPEYHRLRIKELELVADYQEKLAQEKERDREVRERMREEAKVQAEIEREKARLTKQQALKAEALAKARASGDAEAIARLEAEVADAERALEEIDHRATNLRLGHVYVISNIGAFGPEVVKIGMTRRMEPMERVNELGDASVPFRFDVHALIYSEDAVALETALHQRFAAQRINKVNLRREFFRVTPAQVREALIELGSTIIEYTDDSLAEEYRMSSAGSTA